MVESTSALSLAAPEEPTVATFACGLVAILAMLLCMRVGLLRGPMSIVCLMSLASLTLCGCDLAEEDQQGFRLGWVISVEVDWCSQGFLPGFILSVAIGMIGLIAALVSLRVNGIYAEAQPSCLNENDAETDLPSPSESLVAVDTSCPSAQVDDADISSQSVHGATADTTASNEDVADVVPDASLEGPEPDGDEGAWWLSYQEWLDNLDPQEYRYIFNIESEPEDELPSVLSLYGPDVQNYYDDHATARGSDEPPDAQPAGGAEEPNDEPNDEPYVYTTRRGRKLHSTPTCATLYN